MNAFNETETVEQQIEETEARIQGLSNCPDYYCGADKEELTQQLRIQEWQLANLKDRQVRLLAGEPPPSGSTAPSSSSADTSLRPPPSGTTGFSSPDSQKPVSSGVDSGLTPSQTEPARPEPLVVTGEMGAGSILTLKEGDPLTAEDWKKCYASGSGSSCTPPSELATTPKPEPTYQQPITGSVGDTPFQGAQFTESSYTPPGIYDTSAPTIDPEVARIRAAAQSYSGGSILDLCVIELEYTSAECKPSGAGRLEIIQAAGIDPNEYSSRRDNPTVLANLRAAPVAETVVTASNVDDLNNDKLPTTYAEGVPIPRPRPGKETAVTDKTTLQPNFRAAQDVGIDSQTGAATEQILASAPQDPNAPLTQAELSRFSPEIQQAVQKQCELGRCSIVRRIAQGNSTQEERTQQVTQLALIGARDCSKVSILDCFKAADLPYTLDGRRSVCGALGLDYCDSVGSAKTNIQMASDVKKFSQTGTVTDITREQVVTIDSRGAVLEISDVTERIKGESEKNAPSYIEGGTLEDLKGFYDRAQAIKGDTEVVYKFTGDICAVVETDGAACRYYRGLVEDNDGILKINQLPAYTREQLPESAKNPDTLEAWSPAEGMEGEQELFPGPDRTVENQDLEALVDFTKIREAESESMKSLAAYEARIAEQSNIIRKRNAEAGSMADLADYAAAQAERQARINLASSERLYGQANQYLQQQFYNPLLATGQSPADTEDYIERMLVLGAESTDTQAEMYRYLQYNYEKVVAYGAEYMASKEKRLAGIIESLPPLAPTPVSAVSLTSAPKDQSPTPWRKTIANVASDFARRDVMFLGVQGQQSRVIENDGSNAIIIPSTGPVPIYSQLLNPETFGPTDIALENLQKDLQRTLEGRTMFQAPVESSVSLVSRSPNTPVIQPLPVIPDSFISIDLDETVTMTRSGSAFTCTWITECTQALPANSVVSALREQGVTDVRIYSDVDTSREPTYWEWMTLQTPTTHGVEVSVRLEGQPIAQNYRLPTVSVPVQGESTAAFLQSILDALPTQ